jgi:WbqC-like protein family
MKAAIIQSNYIPWKGYFDIIHDVDLFILHDDLQYTERDWRNRNLVKTENGPQWLTVPVRGGSRQKICEARIDWARDWRGKHLRVLERNYRKSPFFEAVFARFEKVLDQKHELLVDLDTALLRDICAQLGIGTRIVSSTTLPSAGAKDEKVVDLCLKAGADAYLSGPAGRNYIRPELFERAGIALGYKDYGHYPEYPQFFPPFIHGVSILDLLFHTGPEAPEHIWGAKARHAG